MIVKVRFSGRINSVWPWIHWLCKHWRHICKAENIRHPSSCLIIHTRYNGMCITFTAELLLLLDKKTMVHLHNGILHSREKEGAYTLCNSMDGTGEHYAK